jgi:cytochrome c biogenesis DsbD-like protein
MRQTFVAFVLLVSAALATAQAAKVQYVSLEQAPAISVAHGRTAPVTLTFTIEPKVHINSNIPSSETLIPTGLTLQPPPELTFGKLRYPAGHDFSFPFAPGEKLSVYTDSFQVRTTVRASRAAKPGEYHVSGILGYQACNDHACFPPKKLPVDLVVTVRRK